MCISLLFKRAPSTVCMEDWDASSLTYCWWTRSVWCSIRTRHVRNWWENALAQHVCRPSLLVGVCLTNVCTSACTACLATRTGRRRLNLNLIRAKGACTPAPQYKSLPAFPAAFNLHAHRSAPWVWTCRLRLTSFSWSRWLTWRWSSRWGPCGMCIKVWVRVCAGRWTTALHVRHA